MTDGGAHACNGPDAPPVGGSPPAVSTSAKSFFCACISHVPLLFDYPPYVKPVYLGEAQAEGQWNLRDMAPHWVPHHGVIGSAAGVFALKDYLLRHRPDVTHVGICQYRKFMTRTPFGRPSPHNHVMDVISRGEIDPVALGEAMQPGTHDFLVVRPGLFNLGGTAHGYLYQYKDVHHVEDFLRFVAVAVELGVIDKHEVIPLFDEKLFLLGGIELGVFPTTFWIPAISAIEGVVSACIERYGTRREGAQARVWGFCLERLSSYLVLKHLGALGGRVEALAGHLGHLNAVTEDGRYVPGM